MIEKTNIKQIWNRDGSDNAAIEAVSLDGCYRVERLPSMGRYDLSIRNTTYDRDNGSFKCMLKEGGTGRTLYTKTVGLTVLLKPSAPRISPSSPIATEGRPTNLTCSSTGGSPPPQVWIQHLLFRFLENFSVISFDLNMISLESNWDDPDPESHPGALVPWGGVPVARLSDGSWSNEGWTDFECTHPCASEDHGWRCLQVKIFRMITAMAELKMMIINDNNDDNVAGALCGIGLSANGRSWKQGQVSV